MIHYCIRYLGFHSNWLEHFKSSKNQTFLSLIITFYLNMSGESLGYCSLE
jgi:hypothetical protein